MTSPGGRPILLALAAVVFAACDADGPLDPGERDGALDVSRVVAVGDGFMAGAANDALYATAQGFSPPTLFVERSLGRDPLLQPLVSDPGFALEERPGGRLELVAIKPLVLQRRARGGPLLAPPPEGPYENLGVPGALLAEALSVESEATSLLGNPFYDLVLRGRGAVSAQVAEAGATLVLVWYGTSDVLAWVAAGGDSDLAPGLPTPGGTFAAIYERLLDQLMETTDQVALFTVPDVTLLPLLHAVPPHVVDPETGEPVVITRLVPKIDPDTGEPVVDEDGNVVEIGIEIPAPLIGPEGELTGDDRVTLEARSLIAAGIGIPQVLGGTGEPLPDRAVLDPVERQIARDAVSAYNEAIRRLARERNLALVDVHALVESLAGGGIVSDGVRLTTEWLFGQAFGLDGAHFTPKGNGVVVNLLVDALNERYGSRLPHVPTADLPGVPLLRLD